MLLDKLINKWTLGLLLSIAGFSGIYRFYLSNMSSSALQGTIDNNASSELILCKTADASKSHMSHCDYFYLDYLPKITSSTHKKNIFEVPKLGSEIIISTYQDTTILRQKYRMKPYPKLEVLSNGKLTAASRK